MAAVEDEPARVVVTRDESYLRNHVMPTIGNIALARIDKLRTLVRRAEAEDLPTACKALAATVGGNPVDLLSFADWSVGSDAEIVNLADRRRN
jgi:hypothetical protein